MTREEFIVEKIAQLKKDKKYIDMYIDYLLEELFKLDEDLYFEYLLSGQRYKE